MRRILILLLLGFGLALGLGATPAQAEPVAPLPAVVEVAGPVRKPTPPVSPKVTPTGNINFNINSTNPDGSKPATSLVIVLGLTLLSVAPAVLLLTTSFTKVFMVLGIARNALGLTSMPPNQVIAGLALFISLFIMSPTLSQVNEQGVQPYLKGDKSQSVAFKDGVQPLREFMFKTARPDEIALMIKVSGQEQPSNKRDVALTTLVPAFILSELRAAFIIGFVIVPDHRHGGLGVADVAGHDDAATGDRRPAVQAAALRPGQRVGADHHGAGGEL